MYRGELKLRKLVTNDWVHVSRGLVPGSEGGWEAVEIAYANGVTIKIINSL